MNDSQTVIEHKSMIIQHDLILTQLSVKPAFYECKPNQVSGLQR